MSNVSEIANNLKKKIKKTRFGAQYRNEHLISIENFLKLDYQFNTDDIIAVLDAFHLMQDPLPEPSIVLRLRNIISDIVNRFISIMDLQSLNEVAAFYIRFWENDKRNIDDLGKSIPIQEKWVELALQSWPKHTNHDNNDDNAAEYICPYECPCSDLSEWLFATAQYYTIYAFATNDYTLLKKTQNLIIIATEGKQKHNRYEQFIDLVNKAVHLKEENKDLTLSEIENKLMKI